MRYTHPLRLYARAKINLCLDVLRRRADGYHELDTIFQLIGLHDTIELYSAEDGISIHSDEPGLPTGARNIVYRAAELLRLEYGVDYGVSAHIHKKIPVAAGLGGGSADAAAVLRGLPGFWRLPPLPEERLAALSRALGADVPFLLGGSPAARAGGIGDEMTAVPSLGSCEVLLIKPKTAKLSTASVYEELDLQQAVHPEVDAVAAAMGRLDLEAMGRSAANVLEKPAMRLIPEIREIKDALIQAGAVVALMSGSGPTVFALGGRGWARRAAKRLRRPHWHSIVTRTM